MALHYVFKICGRNTLGSAVDVLNPSVAGTYQDSYGKISDEVKPGFSYLVVGNPRTYTDPMWSGDKHQSDGSLYLSQEPRKGQRGLRWYAITSALIDEIFDKDIAIGGWGIGSQFRHISGAINPILDRIISPRTEVHGGWSPGLISRWDASPGTAPPLDNRGDADRPEHWSQGFGCGHPRPIFLVGRIDDSVYSFTAHRWPQRLGAFALTHVFTQGVTVLWSSTEDAALETKGNNSYTAYANLIAKEDTFRDAQTQVNLDDLAYSRKVYGQQAKVYARALLETAKAWCQANVP